MITYEETLAELSAMKDEKYRLFNERIANIPAGTSIGVRTPLLRGYAKKFIRREELSLDELLRWPDELFEIRLLKCLCVAYLRMPFAQKMRYVARCLPVLDGWAVCDLFCSTLKEVKAHREEFLPFLRSCVEEGSEFYQRFAYVMLLGCYMEEAWLPEIFSLLGRAHTQYFYTRMGAAWLIAEVLVKFYDAGVAYLRASPLDAKTLNKAIQKARESYRLSDEQKNSLKLLKK